MLLQLTASVTRLGRERALAVETECGASHENAQKTRCVPQVGCTLCWANNILRESSLVQ